MRVLFAWELGENLGHIAPFAPVARGLHSHGCEVHLALPQFNDARRFFGTTVSAIHAAPRWNPMGAAGPSRTYADLLRPFGYGDPEGLASLIAGWRTLVDRISPDVIVFDSAPTALLATRDWVGRRVLFSNGYSQPPLTHPLPAMEWWEESIDVASAEASVVEVIDAARRLEGLPPIGQLRAMFEPIDRRLVQGVAAVDAYGAVRSTGEVEYLGIGASSAGTAPDWPDGSGPRVFAYLSPHYPALGPILMALSDAKARVLAYVPHLPESAARRIPGVSFSRGPLAMDALCTSADAAVCHSASGTGAAFAAAGRPVLLLPIHLEQEMSARGLVDARAAVMAKMRDPGSFTMWLKRLISAPLRKGAADFAPSMRRSGDPIERAVAAILGAETPAG